MDQEEEWRHRWSAVRKAGQGKGGLGGTKRRRCGECSGCLAENCGTCGNCLDMPKFGGPGSLTLTRTLTLTLTLTTLNLTLTLTLTLLLTLTLTLTLTRHPSADMRAAGVPEQVPRGRRREDTAAGSQGR